MRRAARKNKHTGKQIFRKKHLRKQTFRRNRKMKGGYTIETRVIFNEDEKRRIINYNSHINPGVPEHTSQFIRDTLFPNIPNVHKDIVNHEIRQVLGWNQHLDR